MLSTPFTELVGCRVPIQQAPMGAVSTPRLARAVAEAGGLGTIGALGASPGALDAAVADVAGGGAVAVNFLTEEIDEEALSVAARRARVVDFFWLRPRARLVELVHEHGALVCWQVGSADEAVAAAAAGCDLVAAQGVEAGGHVWGDQPLLALLAEVVERVDVPVLAAGGISDARSLAAVLAAGASGARIGTRFIATEESGAHPRYVDAVVAAGSGDTLVSGRFSVDCPLCASRARARVLRSAVAAADALDDEVVATATVRGQAVPVPRFAGMPPYRRVDGAVEAMALYAGQGVGRVEAVAPAGAVVAELCEGAEALLRAW